MNEPGPKGGALAAAALVPDAAHPGIGAAGLEDAIPGFVVAAVVDQQQFEVAAIPEGFQDPARQGEHVRSFVEQGYYD
jgi:hypothetical protein